MGDRLKEERERLGLTQPQVAKACGVVKQTVIRWEKGRPIPSSKLVLLEAIGFDIHYVTTGNRSGQPIPSEEATANELLDTLELIQQQVGDAIIMVKRFKKR